MKAIALASRLPICGELKQNVSRILCNEKYSGREDWQDDYTVSANFEPLWPFDFIYNYIFFFGGSADGLAKYAHQGAYIKMMFEKLCICGKDALFMYY